MVPMLNILDMVQSSVSGVLEKLFMISFHFYYGDYCLGMSNLD